jgi:hypothetical protein
MRLSRPRSVPRTIGVVTASLVALAGCAVSSKPGVDIADPAANLAFGAAVTEATVLPPSAAGLPLPPPGSKPPAFGSFNFGSYNYALPKAQQCPAAGPNAFPKVIPAVNVNTGVLPRVGDYLWTFKGTQTLAIAPTLKLPVQGFEHRQISNVQMISAAGAAPEFTFDQTQVDRLNGAKSVITYKVISDGVSTEPYYHEVAPPSTPAGDATPPSAGDPERGVSIAKIVTTGGKGAAGTTAGIASFAPVKGLLLAPLPIQVDESFDAMAVDPNTFETATYQGTVGAQVRVNACGDIVAGYPISGQEVFSSGSNSQTLTYTIVIAPQYGGIPVQEHIVLSSPTGGSEDITYTIGQLAPTPIKKAAKS